MSGNKSYPFEPVIQIPSSLVYPTMTLRWQFYPFSENKQKPEFKKKDKLLDSLTCLNDLPSDHVAVHFANMRKIPKQHWGILYYTDDFANFSKK